MDITVVGNENGQASGIKLLRSAYTKGVSALLFESIYHAAKLGIDKEVLNTFSETEGPDFTDSSVFQGLYLLHFMLKGDQKK